MASIVVWKTVKTWKDLSESERVCRKGMEGFEGIWRGLKASGVG